MDLSQECSALSSKCLTVVPQALEVVPYTLAQNAGLNALLTVTELRNRHANGDRCAGINVRRVRMRLPPSR